MLNPNDIGVVVEGSSLSASSPPPFPLSLSFPCVSFIPSSGLSFPNTYCYSAFAFSSSALRLFFTVLFVPWQGCCGCASLRSACTSFYWPPGASSCPLRFVTLATSSMASSWMPLLPYSPYSQVGVNRTLVGWVLLGHHYGVKRWQCYGPRSHGGTKRYYHRYYQYAMYGRVTRYLVIWPKIGVLANRCNMTKTLNTFRTHCLLFIVLYILQLPPRVRFVAV